MRAQIGWWLLFVAAMIVGFIILEFIRDEAITDCLAEREPACVGKVLR